MSYSNKGFTRQEALIVLGVLVVLVVATIFSISVSNKKARDAVRLSDVRRMSVAIEEANTKTPHAFVPGCTHSYAPTVSCIGDDGMFSLSDFVDPSDPVSPCLGNASGAVSDDVCAYSISSADGKTQARLNDYQVCFFLEIGTSDYKKGIYRVENGGNISAGCN